MIPDIKSWDITNLKGLNIEEKDICTLEASVPTGFEDIAAEECREKLNATATMIRGRIFFDLPISHIPQALKLRSIEHLYVVLSKLDLNFTEDRDECFKKLYRLPEQPDWHKGMRAWHQVFEEDCGNLFEDEQILKDVFCPPRPDLDLKIMHSPSLLKRLPENILTLISEAKIRSNSDVPVVNNTQDNVQIKEKGPKFRVTCNRTGSKHVFASSEASRQFGAGINEKFGWPVDLTKYQLHVVLNITNDLVYVCISLSREPLFRRNISHFGPTTLKGSICYSLLKLAKPTAGDIVLDHMCGGGSIPIEGSLSLPGSFYLAGDIFGKAVQRTQMNIEHIVNKKKSLPIDYAIWDATKLPLRPQSVDVVVTDLPFGKRMGSKSDNRVLYLRSLIQVATITRVNTGRAVMLTHDKTNMIRSLQKVSSLWKNVATRSINIGGLSAGVFLLRRTSLLSNESLNSLLVTRRERKFNPPPNIDKES